jgi:hypothetical protein
MTAHRASSSFVDTTVDVLQANQRALHPGCCLPSQQHWVEPMDPDACSPRRRWKRRKRAKAR